MTSQAGSYILQWKYFDAAKGSFDILSTHKSKVMYYSELLPSEKFKLVQLRIEDNLFMSLIFTVSPRINVHVLIFEDALSMHVHVCVHLITTAGVL